jgi:hypothetical protein
MQKGKPMLTKTEYDLLKAKTELTDEEKASIAEFEKSQTDDKNKVPSTWEEIFKHPRFKELDQKAKDAERKVKDIETEQKNKEIQADLDAKNWKKLYEGVKADYDKVAPRAAFADEAEKTLQGSLEAQIQEIPEHFRSLVPDGLSVSQKLNWISQNKPLLMKEKGFDIAAGKQGGGSPETNTLTPEQKEVARLSGIPETEYAKYL